MSLLQYGASLLFRIHGYSYYSNDGFGYWYRSPNSPSLSSPIVIIHGIGSVLSLLWFVTNLAIRAPDRDIFVLDIASVSMRLPRPTFFPTAESTTASISQMLQKHLPTNPPAIFFGHSLGSAPIVWLLKHASELIAGIVLVDPISLLLQHVDVAHNFIYRKPESAAEHFFEWIAREPGNYKFSRVSTNSRYRTLIESKFPLVHECLPDDHRRLGGCEIFPEGYRE